MIKITDNFQVNKPAPIDDRLGPFASTAVALSSIELDRRYIGLTVIVDTGSGATEYWFEDGIQNNNLVVKSSGGGSFNCADLLTCPDFTDLQSDVTTINTTLTGKVDKVAGKGLSTEDYTSAEKTKLAGIEPGAEVNVNADWNATSGDAEILNKPTIPTSLPPSGTAGGDLSGTYPDPTVHRIHGVDFQSGTPSAGDVWIYGGSPAKWQHQSLTKSDVGLGNVPNLDATNPANISQNSSYRFVTDTEKATWNGKQDSLGFTPENVANKQTDLTASATKYPTVNAVNTGLNTRSYSIGSAGSASITIATIGSANLVTVSGHTFTINEADMPIGATIQVNGLIERTTGTTGNCGMSYDVNGTKRYYVLNGPANSHQWQYQFTLYRESSSSIRLMGGSSATFPTSSFFAANIATATATVTGGGTIVLQISGWGTVVSEVFAFRFFKAILTR